MGGASNIEEDAVNPTPWMFLVSSISLFHASRNYSNHSHGKLHIHVGESSSIQLSLSLSLLLSLTSWYSLYFTHCLSGTHSPKYGCHCHCKCITHSFSIIHCKFNAGKYIPLSLYLSHCLTAHGTQPTKWFIPLSRYRYMYEIRIH